MAKTGESSKGPTKAKSKSSTKPSSAIQSPEASRPSTLSSALVHSSDDSIGEDSDAESEAQPAPSKSVPRTLKKPQTPVTSRPTIASRVEPSSAKSVQSTTQEFTSAGDLRPAQPFKPPPGFAPLATKPSFAGEYFTPKYLNGKQVFYVTAPANLSLDKVKEISWSQAQQGKEVFNGEKASYSLELDNDMSKKGMRVMLPMTQGYKSVHAKIDHVLHFQEVPNLPKLKRAADEELPLPAKRPRRKQPKGLRMRFRPTGFGSDSLGTMGGSDDEGYVDVDMVDAPPVASSSRLEGTPAKSKEKSVQPDGEKSKEKSKEKKKRDKSASKDKDKLDKAESKGRGGEKDDKEKRKLEKKKRKEKEAAEHSESKVPPAEVVAEIRPKVTELQKENEALYGEQASKVKDVSKEKKKKKKDKTKVKAEA